MTVIEGIELPEDAVDLGHGTYYSKSLYGDVWVGIHEWHKEGDQWSAGYIPFANRAQLTGGKLPDASVFWEVQSQEPLTLSPSIACQGCGHHGYIRAGRWWPV
jgi:hypothetical protein